MSEGNNWCSEHKEHDHRIAVLEKKSEELENEIDGLGGEVNRIDKEFAVTKGSIMQSLALLSKLPDTLSEVRLAMVNMQHNLSENNKSVEALTTQISGLNDKINSVDNKVDAVSASANFNWVEYIKKNWPVVGFMILVGLAWVADKVGQLIK